MPKMMNKPVKISNIEIFFLSNMVSRMAVNKVKADKQTSATETVADLMD